MIFNNQTRSPKLSHYATNTSVYRELAKTNNNFGSNFSTSPAFGAYWHVVFDCIDFPQDTDIVYDIRLKYYVILYNPLDLNES